MPALWKRVQGQHGRVDIPDLGALIGKTSSWTLTRRGSEDPGRDPEADFYDFHAVLEFVNEALFADDEYTKRVTIQMGKGQTYCLEPQGTGQRTSLVGRSLNMERVALVRSV